MVTLDNIHALDSYRNLLLIGCRDLGDDTRSRRPELKINIEHDALGAYTDPKGGSYKGNFTIFKTGYIRFFGDKPTMFRDALGSPLVKKFYTMSLEEWDESINEIFVYIFKKIIHKQMSLPVIFASHIVDLNPFNKQLEELIKDKPVTFFKWLQEYNMENADAILSIASSSIIKAIEKNPTKWPFILKEFYKLPSLIEITGKLNSKTEGIFSQDINLIGDLSNLGL